MVRRFARLLAVLVVLASVAGIAAAHDDGKEIGNSAQAGTGGGGPFPAANVELLAHLPLSDIGGGGSGVLGNDLWGWTDALTGKEYALFGRTNGTSFIDISDPVSPVYLGDLPTYTGDTAWRDVKVYQDHAYIVADNNGAHGMQIFDLTTLRGVVTPTTFTETAHYSGFTSAHNIVINEETGYAYAVGTNTFSGGLHVIDLQDPINPVFAGAYDGDGYTHDAQVLIYNGTDSAHVGSEIAFNANEDTLTIVDVTVKNAPVQLSRTTYAERGYTHQGWVTEDHRYYIMNDELDELNFSNNTRTHVWDIQDLDAPQYLGNYESSTLGTIDHNLYVHEGLIYAANYTSGLRVLEMTDPDSAGLTEVASFDTYPTDDLSTFNGAWSVYPFFDSGSIIVSDRQNGLFVLGLDLTDSGHQWATAAASESWGTATNWLVTGVPAGYWNTTVENTQAYDQTAVVGAVSTVDSITIGGLSNSMMVHVEEGVELTAKTQVDVDSLGIARVDGSLATDTLNVNSGGAVRVALSSPAVSHIAADADATIAAGATLSIDAGTPPPAGAHLFSIIVADADSTGGGTLTGTFDTVNLPGDDGLGRRYRVLYENRAGDGIGVVDTVKVGLARPGDGNFDSAVDSIDLLAASPFFDTTTPANWRQGNWNDTGGSQGVVDSLDLLDASPFFDQTYGSGELALGGDVTTPGQNGDGNPSICYDYTTGEVIIDTDGNTANTYVLDSLSGIFTGLPANFIGGTIFQTDNDFRIAENFHTNLNGVHNLGAVAQTGLSLGFLLNDLTLQGGSAGNPNFEFDLVVKNTPEPSTLMLLGLGLVALVVFVRRRTA